MPRKKMAEKDKQKFQNVGLIREDHILLRKLAEEDQRSMARQISVLIRKEIAERKEKTRQDIAAKHAGV
jgi:hypothetical protein